MHSNDQGAYEFKSLAPGTYTLTVVAQGFSLYENDNVVIATQALRLNVVDEHRGRRRRRFKSLTPLPPSTSTRRTMPALS